MKEFQTIVIVAIKCMPLLDLDEVLVRQDIKHECPTSYVLNLKEVCHLRWKTYF